MRLPRRYGEQPKLLKTDENQRVQTGQVGLANRPIKPLWHLSSNVSNTLAQFSSWLGALLVHYNRKTLPPRDGRVDSTRTTRHCFKTHAKIALCKSGLMYRIGWRQ